MSILPGEVVERTKKEIDVLFRSIQPMLDRYARIFAADWPRIPASEFTSIAYEAAHDCALRFDAEKGSFSGFARVRVLGAFYDYIRKELRESNAAIDAVRAASIELPPKAEPLPFDATPAEARAHLVREQRLRVQRMALMAVATQEQLDPETLILEKHETATAVAAMNAALAELKGGERIALLRTRVHGKTLEETATELGVSTKSVQRYIERAATRLRQALIEAGIETAESALDAVALFVEQHPTPK